MEAENQTVVETPAVSGAAAEKVNNVSVLTQTPEQKVATENGGDNGNGEQNNGNGIESPQANAEGSQEKKGEQEQKPQANAEANKGEAEKTETEVYTPKLDAFKFDESKELGKDVSFEVLAKELGFETKANDINSFKESFQSFLENKNKEASESTFLSALEKQPAQAQEAFLLAKNGLSLREIEAPAEQAKQILSLDDVGIVEADLRASGRLSEEAITAQIEKLTESGQIENAAGVIRQELQTAVENHLQWRKDLNSQLLAKEKEFEQAQKTEQYNAIEKAFVDTSEFLGQPLPENVRKDFAAQLKAGKFEDVINTPQAIAEAKAFYAMYKTMGKYVLDEIQKSTESRIRLEIAKKQHNIPNNSGGGSVVTPPRKQNDASILRGG